jgi:hypothetical protein
MAALNQSQPSGEQLGALPPLRLEWVEAESLDDNPRNWRRHPEKQMAALRDGPRRPLAPRMQSRQRAVKNWYNWAISKPE